MSAIDKIKELAQSTAEELRHCIDDFGDDGWGFNIAMVQDHLLRAFQKVSEAEIADLKRQRDELIDALDAERNQALEEAACIVLMDSPCHNPQCEIWAHRNAQLRAKQIRALKKGTA